MSKYTPIPDFPEYEIGPDKRVRKASNRHWVTDPFLLDELGVGEPPEPIEYWLLGCCGRPWFATDLWGAREHQALCVERIVSTAPGHHVGWATTLVRTDRKDPVVRRTDKATTKRWGPLRTDLLVQVPEGWKPGDPLTQAMNQSQMRAYAHDYQPSPDERV